MSDAEAAVREDLAGQGASGHADRAEVMGRRVQRTAERLGIATADREMLARAFRVAMEPRRAALDDDHHPDYLHTARTALILMDDTRETDPVVLATALLAETRNPSLTPDTRAVRRVSARATDWLSRLPRSEENGDQLLETLLALPAGIGRVAVAERLDHARHLHLRDGEEWERYHAITRRAYAPFALRLDPVLGRRLDRWCSTFRRRFLEG